MKKMILAVALAASTSAAWAQNSKVCFEAEGAQSIASPLLKKTPGTNKAYSGRGYVEIPWDQNKSKGLGNATIRFNAKKAGTYYLWARVFWANGCGNSIAASVNNGNSNILGEDGQYDRWHWVGGTAKVSLKAGQNVLVLANRETGVKVDQFFLTTDPGYTPVGTRKVTS